MRVRSAFRSSSSPPLAEAAKTPEHLIKGCQSQVWLDASSEEGRVRYFADSDSLITKGMIALFIRVLDDESPDAILQLGFGFWGSKALLSAVELGVFTALAGTSAELEPLRARLGLHPRSARDFLDALVALGMLKRQDGRYANTPATEAFLDRAKPSYLGGILEMANARLFRFWADLTEGLRTGLPQEACFFTVLER